MQPASATSGHVVAGKKSKPAFPPLWRARSALLLYWVAVCYLILVAFPPSPEPLGARLDLNSFIGFNMAHAQGLAMGKDLFWTYGPLVYLQHPDPLSGAKYFSLAFRLGTYLIWVAALILLLRRSPNKWLGLWAAVVLAWVTVLDPLLGPERLELAIITAALLPLAWPGRFRYLELTGLAVLASIATLLRFNLGLQYAPLFLGVYAVTVWRDRPLRGKLRWQAGGVLLAFPVFTFVIYLCCGGSAGLFLRWLGYSLEMARAYSEAMSLSGPAWEVVTALATAAFLFVAIPLLARRRAAIAPALAIGLLPAFAAFKHSFVRQEPVHASQFEPRLVLLALLVLFCCAARRERRLMVAFQAVCLIAATCYSWHSFADYRHKMVAMPRLSRFLPSAHSYLNWTDTWQRLGVERTRNTASLRLGKAFSQRIGQGSVDSLPYDVAQVQVNGWRWRPAPVFQLYVAQSPKLDHLDANHYDNPRRAADYIVMGWNLVDGRNPFFDTPATWRALLNWYDLDLQTADKLLLRRRMSPRFLPLQLAGSGVVGWGQRVFVTPQPGLLVMSADMHRNAWGRIRTVAFRLSPSYVDVAYRSGLQATWRMLPASAADGVIVNGLPTDLAGVAQLLQFATPTDPVVWLRFRTSGPREYHNLITIHWYRLPVASQAPSRTPQSE